ncbi:MAG: helix-turn-helix transcriptional regulator [Alphaproteobacteria bacterium]|nr:helix-turn-helix transcriptional regulator [Alphaproteobacteria bacterium]
MTGPADALQPGAEAAALEQSLNTGELLQAIHHLLMARPEPAFLVGADGRVVAESPGGALARASLPGFDRVMAELVRQSPRKADFLVRPDLGVGLQVTPCSARGAAPAYLVIISKLAAAGRGRLTLRQAELIGLLQDGLSNAQIARRMGIAASTVKTMLERLYRFAGVSNRQSLVHWASGARFN